ncbi:MAG: VanW family protein, partial [Candidatus Curtissbacteria bacterium GW2011_GWA1_41_11]
MKRKKSELNKALGIFTITFFSLSMIFLVYAVLFASKALPNTYFTNFNVAGRNIEQISKVVDNRIESFETEKITILAGNAKIELLPHELGIDFDNEISKQNIFDLFIADNPLEDYGNRMTALFFKKKIKPSYKVDYSKLSNLLDEKFADIEKKASDATISFGTGEVEILKEKNGVVVDRTKLVSDLVSRLDNFSNAPIIATYIEDKPKIKNENAKAAFEKVKTLNNQNIILSYGFDTWTITGETLADLLKFYARGQIDNNLVSVHLSSTPLIINDVNFKGKEQPALEVQLDNEKLALFIEEIAIVVDKPTVDATLELDGVKVSKFTPAQDGQALDKTLTKDLILNVVSVDNLDSREEVAIKLPVNVTKARIANEEINSLGIRELVASGNSYFAGSIPNRVFNIGLGASLINGTLVPPGEVFSFNSIVGPVSAEQGFKQAYVINKGRTVLDDGGGICQVSTTVFRAALN